MSDAWSVVMAESAARNDPTVPRRRLALEGRSPALRAVVLILAVDTVVIVLHVLNRITGLDKRLFDLDGEQNLPTWVSSTQFFGVALCAALLSVWVTGRQRLAWRVFAGIFLFLSLDELALLHEELVDRVSRTPSGDAAFWPLFYLPLGLGVLLAVAVVLGEVRRFGGSVALVAAGLTLLGGALVLDAVATKIVDEPLLFEPELVLEEGFEFLGTAVLIGVLLAVLLNRLERQRSA